MKWQEEDSSLLLSAADELSDYLDSSVIDWLISSSRLVLTPGRVLLAIKRLSTISNIDPKVSILIELTTRRINTRHIAWQKKIDLELPRRLKVWENALMEYREEGLDLSYNAQVVNRTILNLLAKEANSLPPSFETHLSVLDNELRMLLKPGGFIWDEQLMTVFPMTDYWFLYNKEKKA
jgi:hypothetical protein